MTPEEILEIERKALKKFKEKEYVGINIIEDINKSLQLFIIKSLREVAKEELYPEVKETNLTKENKINLQNWMKHKLYNCIRSYREAETYEYSEDPVFLIPPPSGAADKEDFIDRYVLPNICKSCQKGFLEQSEQGLVCQQCSRVDETIFQGGVDQNQEVSGSLDRWSTKGNKIRKKLFEFYELNTDKISMEQIMFITRFPKKTKKKEILLKLLQILKKNKVSINLLLKQKIIEHFQINNINEINMIINFN